MANISYSYLVLVSIIHFFISSINFFNSDGKYAIGLKEDSRIAFDVVRNCTLCGDGDVSHNTKGIMTDIHMEIAKSISIEPFDVNDLWNFLNNTSFYTNSIISFLNKDIFTLHPSTLIFLNNLQNDFDSIKQFDYRQVEKTSIAILYYLIFEKISNASFIPKEAIVEKIFKGIKDNYYKKLYNLFFNNEVESIQFLLNKDNMPASISTIEGHNKLLLNLVNIYKK
ncbi:hypothetical protein R0131_10555 [Clostridium sp. AL.422]|nr:MULTISPECIES: hypothetical protein [unclassified Clostridium]MDV4151282.1 hypothetical protein [Clostridium sp. AL.422]